MKTKITLPDGQVYRIGDVYRQPLKPEQFHKDDNYAARIICEFETKPVVMTISDDEQEMVLMAGSAARFLTASVSDSFTLPDAVEPISEPESAPKPEPQKKRGRPRKTKIKQ